MAAGGPGPAAEKRICTAAGVGAVAVAVVVAGKARRTPGERLAGQRAVAAEPERGPAEAAETEVGCSDVRL